MDGLTGLEEGARAIFPEAVIQRCIVHLVRNSIKFIPQKQYKAFTAHLKLIYKAPNRKVALLEFEKFKEAWQPIPEPLRSGKPTGSMWSSSLITQIPFGR